MNALDNLPVDRSQQPVTTKNRVMTVLMIGLVWLMVLLFSAKNNLGWERAFWFVALIFGAFPATACLVCAIFFKQRIHQRRLRTLSVFTVPISILISYWLLGGNTRMDGSNTSMQTKIVILLIEFLVVGILLMLQFKLLNKVKK